MTDLQLIIMILMAALGTIVTRFLPFAVFNSSKPTPKYLEYLGKYLPPAVFGMLVVYCLKGVSFSSPEGFLPELIAVSVTVILHLSFKKMLVSIAGGTAVYMILVNLIFV
jgi:branched-subunit amino acid transport protein AzlD